MAWQGKLPYVIMIVLHDGRSAQWLLPQTAPVALLQFWKKYDKTLSDFMRNGMGISVDLTAVSPGRLSAVDTPSSVSGCLLLGRISNAVSGCLHLG